MDDHDHAATGHDRHPRDHHDHQHPHGHLDVFESPAMAAYAELEGEVLTPLANDAIALLAEHAERRGKDVRRVLDLGSGPGVGTCLLADRFGDATVVAVDGSAGMLERATDRSRRRGTAAPVETVQLDLSSDLRDLGRCDVVWASMSVHHLGDEAALLERLHALLEPNGLLALVERGDPLTVRLPDDDLGRPGLWQRLAAAGHAWFDEMRADLPGSRSSGSYPSMLAAAGFELLAERTLTLVLDPPLGPDARRFAEQHVRRTTTQLEHHADAADLRALGALGEHTNWGHAALRTTRQLYIATPATR
jgi:SAM-dependent methyltransferase